MTQPQDTGRRPAGKRFLTIAAFCDGYGCKKTKAYALIAAGALTSVKSGGQTLIEADSAEAWADSLPRFQSRSRAANAQPQA